MNSVYLSGRLTKDPVLHRTANGTAVTSFTLAVNPGKDRDAMFFDCVAWKEDAERACLYLHKGTWTVVSGRLNVREWVDKNGGNRRQVEIVVGEFCGSDKRPNNIAADDFDDAEDDADLPF